MVPGRAHEPHPVLPYAGAARKPLSWSPRPHDAPWRPYNTVSHLRRMWDPDAPEVYLRKVFIHSPALKKGLTVICVLIFHISLAFVLHVHLLH